MKITIESTSRLVEVNGVPARVWEGETDNGIKVVCCITYIAAPAGEDHSQFVRDLEQHQAPTDVATSVFPLRMVL